MLSKTVKTYLWQNHPTSIMLTLAGIILSSHYLFFWFKVVNIAPFDSILLGTTLFGMIYVISLIYSVRIMEKQG